MIIENMTYMRRLQLKYTAVFFLIGVICLLIALLFRFSLSLLFALYFLFYALLTYQKYNRYLKSINNEGSVQYSVISTNNIKTLFYRYGRFSAPTDEIVVVRHQEIIIHVKQQRGRVIKTVICPTKAKHNLVIEAGQVRLS